MNWKVNFLSLEQGCTTPEIPAGNEKNHEKQQQSGCMGFSTDRCRYLSFDSIKKYMHKTGIFLECLLPYMTLEPYIQLRYTNTSLRC